MSDSLADLARWWARATDSSQPSPIVAAATIAVTDDSSTDGASLVSALPSETDLIVLTTDHVPADVVPPAVCAVVTVGDAASVTSKHYDSDGKLDHDAWMKTCVAIRDCMAQLRSDDQSLLEAISAAGDDRLTTCVSILLAAATHELPVLIDGPGPAAALLVATQEADNAVSMCRPLQQGMSPTERETWIHLGLEPVLAVSTGRTDGRLSATAVELINCSLR